MKIILDIDRIDKKDFDAFKSLSDKRKELLKLLEKFEKDELLDFEFSFRAYEVGLYIYLTNESFERNKEFVKKALELMLETNKRDTEESIKRLGIEYYEGVEE